MQYSYQLRFDTGDRAVAGAVEVIDSASGWRLAQTAVVTTVHLNQAVDRSTFAGAAVPEGRTLLFPGALPIRFDTKYLTLTPQRCAGAARRPAHDHARGAGDRCRPATRHRGRTQAAGRVRGRTAAERWPARCHRTGTCRAACTGNSSAGSRTS